MQQRTRACRSGREREAGEGEEEKGGEGTKEARDKRSQLFLEKPGGVRLKQSKPGIELATKRLNDQQPSSTQDGATGVPPVRQTNPASHTHLYK